MVSWDDMLGWKKRNKKGPVKKSGSGGGKKSSGKKSSGSKKSTTKKSSTGRRLPTGAKKSSTKKSSNQSKKKETTQNKKKKQQQQEEVKEKLKNYNPFTSVGGLSRVAESSNAGREKAKESQERAKQNRQGGNAKILSSPEAAKKAESEKAGKTQKNNAESVRTVTNEDIRRARTSSLIKEAKETEKAPARMAPFVAPGSRREARQRTGAAGETLSKEAARNILREDFGADNPDNLFNRQREYRQKYTQVQNPARTENSNNWVSRRSNVLQQQKREDIENGKGKNKSLWKNLASSVLDDEFRVFKAQNPDVSDADIYQSIATGEMYQDWGQDFLEEAAERAKKTRKQEEKAQKQTQKEKERRAALTTVGRGLEDSGRVIGDNEVVARRRAERDWRTMLDRNGGDALKAIEYLTENAQGVNRSKYLDALKELADEARREAVLRRQNQAAWKTRQQILRGEDVNSFGNASPYYAASELQEEIRDVNEAAREMEETTASTNPLQNISNTAGASLSRTVNAPVNLAERFARDVLGSEIPNRAAERLDRANRASQAARAGAGTLERLGYGAVDLAVQQAIQLPFAGLGGTVGRAAVNGGGRLAEFAGSGLGKTVGSLIGPYGVVSGATTAGQELRNAELAGADTGDQWKSALAQAGVESLLDNIGIGNIVKRFNGDVPKSVSRLVSMARQAGIEGSTEYLTGVVQNAIAKKIYDNPEEKGFFSLMGDEVKNPENLEAGILGALMGGVMGAAAPVRRNSAEIEEGVRRLFEEPTPNEEIDEVSAAMKAGTQTADTQNAIDGAASALKEMRNQADDNAAIEATRVRVEQMRAAAEQPRAITEQPQAQAITQQQASAEDRPMSEQVEEILRSEREATVKEAALPVQEVENNIQEVENNIQEFANPLQESEGFVPPATTRAQAMRQGNFQPNMSGSEAIQGNSPTMNQDVVVTRRGTPVARSRRMGYNGNTTNMRGGVTYEGRTEEGTGRHSAVRQAAGSGGERTISESEYPNNEGPEVSKSRLDGRGNHRVDEGVRDSVSPEEPLNIIERVRKGSKHGAAVDNHDLEFYRDKATSFVSEDEEATISVKKDGDIVAFGKTPNSKDPEIAAKLMYTALQNGGSKLDCYGERLAEMYQRRYGFIPVAKVKYNEGDADADMRRYVQEVRGGNPPDIYVMMKNGDDIDTIRKTGEDSGYELTDLDSLPVMKYEDALSYRDGLLAEQQGQATEQPAQTSEQSKQPRAVTEQPQGGTEQPERKQRRLVKRMKKDEELSEQIKNWLDENPDVSNYEVRHNEETVKEAERRVEEGYSSDRFMNVDSRRADVTDVATGFALLRKYNAEKNWDASYNVVQKLSEMSTNTAQALQIYSIYARQTPEGMAAYAERWLKNEKSKLSERQKRKYGDQMKLTEDDIAFITKTMEEVKGMPDGREKTLKMAEINKRMTDKLPASLGKSVRAWARISMLLNPKTLITRNFGSNALVAAINSTVVDPVATLADKLVSGKTGIRTTGARSNGYLKNAAVGMKYAAQDYKMGVNTRGVDQDKWEFGEGKSFNNKTALGRTMNKFDRFVSFILDAGDRPFYNAEFNKSLQNQMRLNKVAEPTEEMMEVANQTALQRTWQDRNKVTRAGFQIVRALNFGHEFGIGTLVAPFVKTPVNLAIATVEYSPIGLVKTLAVDGMRLKEALRTGEGVETAQKKFVDGFGKASAGVMVSLIGKALFEAGLLNGGEDEDWDKNNFMKNVMGIQPYSVKIGDKSYTYDWALPIGGNMGAMADIMKAVQSGGSKTESMAKSVLLNMLTTMEVGGSFLCDQTFMQSLQSLFGEDDIVKGLEKAVPGFVTQFIPFGSLMGQIAGMTDDTARRTTGRDVRNPGEDSETMQSVINRIMAKVPGLTKKLQPALDGFGREQDRFASDDFLGRVLLSFISPGNMKKSNLGSTETELLRLYEAVGDPNAFPTIQDYSIQYDNEEYKLNASEYTAYQKKYGQTAYSALSKVISSEGYKEADDNQKMEMVSLCYQYASETAKYETLGKKGVKYEVSGWVEQKNKQNANIADVILMKSATGSFTENSMKTLKAAKNAGMDLGDYSKYASAIKSMESDRYPDTGKACRHSKPDRGIYTKQDKVIRYIDSLDISNKQKRALWDVEGYSPKNMPGSWWN